MPFSYFPLSRCLSFNFQILVACFAGLGQKREEKWNAVLHTQRGARLSAEEAIKANISSGLSNIYYVFPFPCSTGRLAFAPVLPSAPSFILTLASASWRKFKSLFPGGRECKILFILLGWTCPFVREELIISMDLTVAAATSIFPMFSQRSEVKDH